MASLWLALGEQGRFVIGIAAFITAVGVLWAAGKWLAGIYMQIKWLFSEQHDHEIIHDTLNRLTLAIADITHQVKHNGGTSIPDAIDRFDKKFDQRMDQLNAYLRVTLHTQPKAIFETDTEGGVTYINRAYTQLTGMSLDRVQKFGFVNIIQTEHQKTVLDSWMRAVRSERDFDQIIPLQKADGTEYTGHCVAYVIRGTDGQMIGHLGEIIPIEDQQGG